MDAHTHTYTLQTHKIVFLADAPQSDMGCDVWKEETYNN